MRIRSILTLLILALVFSDDRLPLLSVAQAADITAPAQHVKAWQANNESSTYWPTDPVLCDLVLEGDIVEGDAEALGKAFQTIVGTMNSFSFFLCLRSNGGDLREAVKIAQLVLATQRPSIATVIEDGRTCASACAIVFLAGNAPARVGAWPQRFLHPRGRLLYHATQVDLSRFSDDRQLLEFLKTPTADPRGLKGRIVELHKEGLRDVQSVIATFQRFISEREDLGDHWVRPSLFLEMFAQDPEEWVCVDTVDAIGRWNIQIYGYQPPKPPKPQHYANVCRSAYHWRSDEFAVGAEIDLEDQGELKKPSPATAFAGRNKRSADFDDRFTMSFQAPLAPLTCVVELKYEDDTKKQVDAKTGLTAFFAPSPGAVSRLAPTAYFPAATLLRDLPGVRPAPDPGAARTRPAVAFTDYSNTVLNGCSYKSIPKLERTACQAACATDPACQTYSHNKITQTCELKHTLTARRLDPLWTSGAPSSGPAPARSVRADAMAYYDPGQNRRLAGKLIDETKVESQEMCSDRCKFDPMCLALEVDAATDMCRRFSEVTGVREAPADNESITIEIKKQQ
jgi:hypothetical protein